MYRVSHGAPKAPPYSDNRHSYGLFTIMLIPERFIEFIKVANGVVIILKFL